MTSIAGLQITTSERLLRSYRKSIFSLQGLVEGAVLDFINRHASDPTTVLRNYDRLAHLTTPVIEIDISGGHRLLAVGVQR